MVDSYWSRLGPSLTKHGFTISSFAKKLGLSYQAIVKVRDGGALGSENNLAAAKLLGLNPEWLATGRGAKLPATGAQENADYVGPTPQSRFIRVRGTAKMGDGGFYEEIDDDGIIESYSRDPDAFALRVKGDSMHPAIRHGYFVVVEPNGRCVPGEYVAIELADGQKMVKELVFDRTGEIVVESVNGNRRMTFDRGVVSHMYAISGLIPPSKWRER